MANHSSENSALTIIINAALQGKVDCNQFVYGGSLSDVKVDLLTYAVTHLDGSEFKLNLTRDRIVIPMMIGGKRIGFKRSELIVIAVKASNGDLANESKLNQLLADTRDGKWCSYHCNGVARDDVPGNLVESSASINNHNKMACYGMEYFYPGILTAWTESGASYIDVHGKQQSFWFLGTKGLKLTPKDIEEVLKLCPEKNKARQFTSPDGRTVSFPVWDKHKVDTLITLKAAKDPAWQFEGFVPVKLPDKKQYVTATNPVIPEVLELKHLFDRCFPNQKAGADWLQSQGFDYNPDKLSRLFNYSTKKWKPLVDELTAILNKRKEVIANA